MSLFIPLNELLSAPEYILVNLFAFAFFLVEDSGVNIEGMKNVIEFQR